MNSRRTDRAFQTVNNTALALISLTMIAPLVHLAAISFSSREYAETKAITFWPRGFNLQVYQTIFADDRLWRAMGVSVFITVAGVASCLLLTSTLSYSLSRSGMKGRRYLLQAIVITFIFHAPLIPAYLVIRSLGMENSLWALIIPGALSAFNVIIMKTFFQGISGELHDAAKMDGCTEFGIYFRIVLPLSKAVLATIALFHAVGQWNSYFSALIYIRSKALQPLQIILREMVIEGSADSMVYDNVDLMRVSTPEMMKAGIVVFATLPIIIVYPFLQKYFVKGATLGSLKE